MAVPAVTVSYVFASRIRRAASPQAFFKLGLLSGMMAILITAILGCGLLFLSGKEFVSAVVAILAAHIPVAIIEGFVTGATLSFLYKVRPEVLISDELQ
jgi:cobalt/nickel transport system permease protein